MSRCDVCLCDYFKHPADQSPYCAQCEFKVESIIEKAKAEGRAEGLADARFAINYAENRARLLQEMYEADYTKAKAEGAAEEREACARRCEMFAQGIRDSDKETSIRMKVSSAADELAALIRARGQKKEGEK